MAELSHLNSFWAPLHCVSGSLVTAGNTRVVYKEARVLRPTLRGQAVGRSEGKQLSDVVDSSVTTQTSAHCRSSRGRQ